MRREKVTKLLLMKGKVTKDAVIFYPFKERESGREVENKRWQMESLVTIVPRSSQVSVILTSICRPTVESRGTIVFNATSHLTKMVV